jgi:hypothetical protein
MDIVTSQANSTRARRLGDAAMESNRDWWREQNKFLQAGLR